MGLFPPTKYLVQRGKSMMSGLTKRPQPGVGILYLILTLSFASSAFPQSILTVTPGRSVATVAGTGVLGYSGDNGVAASATLANPSAVAYDAGGNLYLADAQNHVVREVLKSGQITTIAGTGLEGYGGDNGVATSAYLDTPTGVAVDSSGSVYIADSHNQRIRKVSGGIITTIAGTGAAGYSGDGGAATAAQLSLPSAVTIDSNGNLYIADTNNQRIRKITGTAITTIAGNGEESYAGDGTTATAAALDLPTGVAVDATGNVYIADRNNQRVRMVTPAGIISTIAGSGPASFSGGFSGDGAPATASVLAKPTSVSVDGAGNIYIADTDNQRIRQVSGNKVATVTGGSQGFGGDGGAAISAILNSPRAVASDASGNLTIADTLNQRLRTAALPTLTFTNSGVGIMSAAQSVALSNTGSVSITVASIAFTGPFTTAAGGSCGATPMTLIPGANCTQNVVFLPTASGAASGSVVFGGTGLVPQSILLTGTAVQTATTVTLALNMATPFVGQAITFTATVKPTGVGTPTGTVSFYDGTTPLGSSALAAGSASVTTTLAAGAHTITAVYAGDASFTGNTSAALAPSVLDFNLTLGTTASGSQTVVPGQPVTYALNLLPVGGAFTFPITLSATGLPPGATATFTPQVITIGAGPASVAMAIQTAASGASLTHRNFFGAGYGGGTLALSLLLLPFSRWTRSKIRSMRPLTLCAALILSLATIGGLSGCGSGSGFFGQPPQSYTINVIGTAIGAGGATLQHSIAVITLTVQ
jgi:Bacterial Ig-like domain (group 3)/NHL repeat